MLKKVSENIINLLKYFNYSSINAETYDDFIDNKVPSRIAGLVEEKETHHKLINNELLDSLESALDELADLFAEEIDLEDINKRLKDSTK